MLVFKERRVLLLALLLTLSVAAVWRPWVEVDTRAEEVLGWPSHYVRGLSFGIDILGGSRIMLRLEASHVTIELAPEDVDAAYASIRAAFEENLHTTVKEIGYDEATRRVTVEIGLPVTKELIETVIGDHGTVIGEPKEVVSDTTREEVMHSLDMRVNPYGMPGVRFLPVGANFVLFEIAGVEPERAKELLGHQGRLEIFIENESPVLTGGDITFVSPVEYDIDAGSWTVPFGVSGEGAEKWSAASAGKVDHPTGIYLDRPFDAVVVFSRQVLDEAGMIYDNNPRMIYILWEIRGVPHRFYLQVTAVEVQENLPLETLEFLREQREIKTRIILVGEEDDFENVITEIENLDYPSLENAPRGKDWTAREWVERACGLRSMPSITEAVAGQPLTRMIITIGGGATEDARKDAEDLKAVLAQRLPVRISYESETGIDPRLGAGFLREAILAGLVALAGVGMLVYLRYKRLKISAALTGTMIFEVVITIGIAAMLGWVIGIPELGGLVVVIGTGVDHQIIITDEMVRGEIPHAKRISLKGRKGRAFTVIFAAAATTIAAMLMLFWLGFGVMRGFALITMVGTGISVLVTRPVYARIVDAILTRKQSMTAP